MADDPKHAGPPELERRLATIVSADVAEYSRLMAEDEEQTLLTFQAHKQVFESLVALHRGRVFNTAGDAILAEFGSAVEAVRCATEIQGGLRTRNDRLPPSRRVRFRIGVNLGDVMVQGSDLLGDGVNVAARLQAAAEPGGICISGAVYDQILNKLSLSFRSLGEQNYRNIPHSVRTYAIVGADGRSALLGPSATRRILRSPARWAAVASAALLLLAAGVGYWVYSETTQRSEAGHVRIPDNADASSSGAVVDGVYSGPICYGPGRNDPARCYRAQATISQGRISGQWPARDTGVTMIVAGEVSGSGAVTIEMHTEQSDGSRLATVDLLGMLHNGHLDAAGSFRTGRSVNLNWRRN